MMLYIVLGLACFAIYGSKWMLANIKPKPNRAKVEMRKTIKELKEQADELNTPSTYATYSKLNKRIESMEKEMSTMADFEETSGLYWVIILMPYFAAALFIGQSCELNISGDDVYWPLNNIFGTQDKKIYHLSLSAWYLLSLVVIKSLVG